MMDGKATTVVAFDFDYVSCAAIFAPSEFIAATVLNASICMYNFHILEWGDLCDKSEKLHKRIGWKYRGLVCLSQRGSPSSCHNRSEWYNFQNPIAGQHNLPGNVFHAKCTIWHGHVPGNVCEDRGLLHTWETVIVEAGYFFPSYWLIYAPSSFAWIRHKWFSYHFIQIRLSVLYKNDFNFI